MDFLTPPLNSFKCVKRKKNSKVLGSKLNLKNQYQKDFIRKEQPFQNVLEITVSNNDKFRILFINNNGYFYKP